MSDMQAMSKDIQSILDLESRNGIRPGYQGVLSDGSACVFYGSACVFYLSACVFYLNHFYLRSDDEGRSMDVSGLLFY